MAGSPNLSTYHLLKSLPFQIPLHQTFSGSIPYGKEWELPPGGGVSWVIFKTPKITGTDQVAIMDNGVNEQLFAYLFFAAMH